MKTIEEVAYDQYISDQNLPERKRIPAENYIDWANFGANEAQRWIPISESMPEDHAELCLPKVEKEAAITKQVIVKYDDGHCDVDCRHHIPGDNYNFWVISHTGITHWRPIERL